MTSQAIPQNDKALLAAQAKAGQAGVDAYQAAKAEMAADQQQVLQHATQAAQARGGPAQAAELATSQANDAYNKGQAQLSRGQANTAARSAGRQESMNLYNQMVLGSRSLIEDQAEAAALMINTQSEADVAGIRREGESNVNTINSQMELEAAQFEQAMRQAEKDAQLEEERWQREMEQRERLARMSAAASSGGGPETRTATQAEIKAALSQGGIQRLNEVAGSLGARVDNAKLTNETYEALYTGSLMQQNKYGDTANAIFAPLLANGWSERDIAVIGQAWAENGKIDETDLRTLAQYQYDVDNPTPLWMNDPRASSEYGNLSVNGANDLQPYLQDSRNQINEMLANLQNEATRLINNGLKGANADGLQITKADLDFGNLRREIPRTSPNEAAATRWTALAKSLGENVDPVKHVIAPVTAYADLDQAGKYERWGDGNNAWAGDFSFDPYTGEQDRMNRELEYSTRDLYENDESMRPFLDALMGQSRSFDEIANEQGLSESRMIEQILGMKAPDELNLDDYSQGADGAAIYEQFLRANPGMADGSGAEVARLMFQEAMSSADPAYWDALNVSQENLQPYMMMGRQELNDANYMDAAGAPQNKSLSELYNPRSYEEMAREQRELNKADNEYALEERQVRTQFEQMNDDLFNQMIDETRGTTPGYDGMDTRSQGQAVMQVVQQLAEQKAQILAPTVESELLDLWGGNAPKMVEDLENTFIPVGEMRDDGQANYIGLHPDVLDDMSDNQQIRLDGETSVVSLENVMMGLKDTIALSRTTSNFNGANYLDDVSKLGISNAPTDKIGLILNQYMRLFEPGRVSVLPRDAPLAPNTGTGAEFYSGIERDWGN